MHALIIAQVCGGKFFRFLSFFLANSLRSHLRGRIDLEGAPLFPECGGVAIPVMQRENTGLFRSSPWGKIPQAPWKKKKKDANASSQE